MITEDNVREIYRQSFGTDEPDFEALLFKICNTNIKRFKVNGNTVSFLFALPCEIVANGNAFKATYIYAAATRKESRKMGYMGALLDQVKRNTDGILVLRPANEPLIDYYKKLGFSPFTATDTGKSNIYLEPVKEFKTLNSTVNAVTHDGNFTAMSFNSPISLENLYFPYSMP